MDALGRVFHSVNSVLPSCNVAIRVEVDGARGTVKGEGTPAASSYVIARFVPNELRELDEAISVERWRAGVTPYRTTWIASPSFCEGSQ